MCCSAVGQIVYGILMFTALALTLTGMFTPGWRKLEDAPDGAKQQIEDHEFPHGLFPSGCGDWMSDGTSTQSSTNCDDWWKNLPAWNKTVVVAACLAVIVEVLALIWNLLTFCACCCKRHLLHPLTGLAIVASILLAITVIVFGVNSSNSICELSTSTNTENWNNCANGKTTANYSFYITCGALACSLLSIGVGIIASCFADHSL